MIPRPNDRQLERCFADSVEVLLTPTEPMSAIPREGKAPDLNALIHFLCGFSLAGIPALALPCGADDNGLPASAQIVGPRLHDPRVLAVGQALEAALGPGRRPPL
jgi:Asp-tRNA(Asn)/Glu-tRNA(Gln) amidotransferase A subunit family amidase